MSNAATISRSLRTKVLSFLQELGKTFMFPVSTLAFMGILVGLGSSVTSEAMIEKLPFLGNDIIQFIFSFMNTVGGFGFTYLPVMFAMAIPFGMCKRNKGVGAIAAFAGYVAMNLSINFLLNYRGELADAENMKIAGQNMVLGIQSIEMGVLGGIIVGLIVYVLQEKFQDIRLPDAFSFFGGIRFIPI
ncbi:MAG: PTS transporter subunit EIIC, partial [Enterococcus sp.]